MKYNIFSSEAPARPRPGKGTEFIALIDAQISKDMREPISACIFPAAAARLKAVRVQYSSGRWLEPHGQIAQLIGPSGIGKDQLHSIIQCLTREMRQHDDAELRKLAQFNSKPKKEREKLVRPAVAFWCPPADTTKAAFIQNAVACEADGGHAQYYQLPEVEMLDQLCGGRSASSKTLINVFDVKRDGSLRATSDGISGNPVFRADINISSTEEAARSYYRRDIRTGKVGRISFAYKARHGERSGKIPREGRFDEAFQEQLDTYLQRLEVRGDFIIKPLNKIADQLASEMVEVADISDDDVLFDLSHRCIVNAWKKGAILWLLNDQQWTRSIGEFVVWFCYFDLWSKVHVLGDLFDSKGTAPQGPKSGPKNMLCCLSDSFSKAQLDALRQSMGKPVEGGQHLLNVWVSRGFIEYSSQTGLYTKTAKFLKRND